jgi:hypothetical protein
MTIDRHSRLPLHVILVLIFVYLFLSLAHFLAKLVVVAAHLATFEKHFDAKHEE